MREFGRYRIDRRLGAGGMGEVYAATDTVLDRQVALKILSVADPEFVPRFHREAEVLTRLDSPHVTTIYDHGSRDGTEYLVTQLVPGGDLGSLLRRRGPLPPPLAVAVAAQVAEALAAAHQVGVVHRDVKPANVLLHDPDATRLHAYLCDFGIARSVAAPPLTDPGIVAGTWAYLAPERVHGDPGSAASDIYAVGCLLWAMLTGHPPYAGTDLEVAAAHLRAPIPQVGGRGAFPRQLNALLARAMAKDPELRHWSGRELKAELDRMAQLPADGVSVPTGPPTRASSLATGSPRSRRRGVMASVAALALVVATIGGVLVWRERDQPPAATGNTPPTGTDSGSPTATASEQPRQPGKPKKPTGPIAGDLNENGYGDLVFWTLFGDRPGTSWLASDGSQFTRRVLDRDDAVTNDVRIIGNLDGKGDRLYVVQQPTIGQTTLREKRRATVIARLPQPEPGVVPALHVFGDVNGDGRDDLVILFAPPDDAVSARDSLWVALSTGTGAGKGLGPLRRWTGTRDLWRNVDTRLIAGDFDGDGDDDLILKQELVRKNDRPTTVELLRTDRSRFRTATVHEVINDVSANTSYLAADVDGDGRDELVVPFVEWIARVMVIRYDGRFDRGVRWLSIPESGLGPFDEEGFAISDVNGDGRDDLVHLGRWSKRSRQVYVYLSEANRFGPPLRWATVPCAGSCPFLEIVDSTDRNGRFR